MKRTAMMMLVALIAVGLALPGVAEAAKKKGNKKKGHKAGGVNTRMFDVGVDFGVPAYGVFQFGTLTDNGNDDKIDLSGAGTVSFPYMGAHFTLYPSRTWYIQFGIGYLRQNGKADLSSDDIKNFTKRDEDWNLDGFRLDAGIGKVFGQFSRIRPKAGAGLGIWGLSWEYETSQGDETYTGWTVAPYGLVGVDFDVAKMKKWDFFAGVNLRTDLIYTIAPLEYDGKEDYELTFFYMPWSIFLSGGIRF
jgi:hypothetical protein